MANAAALIASQPFRGFLLGHPGGGKTGALASLANAGFKVRMLDFDGNPDPFLLNLDEAAYGNVDIVHFEDELRDAGGYIEPLGVPTAFTDAMKIMKEWRYTDDAGEEVNLGVPRDWGKDTVLVVDSLTTLGRAAFNRAMKAANRNPRNVTHRVWGAAMADVDNFIYKLRAEKNGFHLIILAHLKLQGPDRINEGDDDTTKENKAEIAQLVPHRWWPSMLGRAMTTEIGGRLPTIILAEARERARKMERVLATQARSELDLKVPGKNIKPEYPIETGLLEIFEALGHKAPGLTKPTKED